MTIDRNNPIPLYRQLSDILRHQIEIGELQPGEQIPTEENLIENFKISRITILKALKLLVEEGLIIRQPGKGSYVTHKKIEEPMQSLQGFAELMQTEYPEQIMWIEQYEQIPASRKIAKQLQINENESVQYIKRIHSIDSKPIAYTEIYLPVYLGNIISKQEASEFPIYALLNKKTDIKIWRASQTIRAVSASQEMADSLHIKLNSPILTIERLTFSDNDSPIEFIQLYYPGSKHELVMELFRNPTHNVLRPAKNKIQPVN